jgi:beta-lactamase class D
MIRGVITCAPAFHAMLSSRPDQQRRALLVRGGSAAAAFAASWHAGFAHAGATPDAAIEERADLARHFTAAGTPGTFALFDATTSKLTVVNGKRAAQRFVPASTYKIPNSLIALETGAVKDIDEVLPCGGKPQRRKEWERDMNLRDAIRVSNLPVYQGVARRIGMARMNEWIARLHYGNEALGPAVDRFWLDGPLKISAIEQARFLARLALKQLPLSARAQEMVHDITLVEKTATHALHAKTGWYHKPPVSMGWWVGWIADAQGGVKSFALNLDMHSDDDAPKRLTIGRALLADMGAL